MKRKTLKPNYNYLYKLLDKKSKGFALFYVLLVISVVLIATAILQDTAFGEMAISAERRDSNKAYYIAEAGVECALYHQREYKSFNMRSPETVYSCGATGVETSFTAGIQSASFESNNVINETDSCYWDSSDFIWYGLVDDIGDYDLGTNVGQHDPFVIWDEDEVSCTRVSVTVISMPRYFEGEIGDVVCGVEIRSEAASECNPDGTPAPNSVQRNRIERSID